MLRLLEMRLWVEEYKYDMEQNSSSITELASVSVGDLSCFYSIFKNLGIPKTSTMTMRRDAENYLGRRVVDSEINVQQDTTIMSFMI